MPPLAFVTGGTGFIGQNLIELLTEQGWDVVAAHRRGADAERLRALGAEPREVVLEDVDSVAAAMPGDCDAVFHLAAATSTWRGANARQTRTNVDGTRAVVAAALRAGVRRLVHTSSIAAYGTPAYRERITEESPSDAATHWVNYVRTKWLAEQAARAACAEGLEVVLLNPANVVGRYDTHNWSRLFLLTAQGKLPGVPPGAGSWCDVREVARAHLAAAECGRPGENYLLGGVDASYVEVTRLVAERTGSRAPRPIPAWAMRALGRVNDWVSLGTGREPDITPEGAFFVCGTGTVDSSKARRELGFRAVPLPTMVDDTIDWLREARLLH
jgi:nucleoside-diphosphate-sugar epimerase